MSWLDSPYAEAAVAETAWDDVYDRLSDDLDWEPCFRPVCRAGDPCDVCVDIELEG